MTGRLVPPFSVGSGSENPCFFVFRSSTCNSNVTAPLSLPADHSYVQNEVQDMAQQLEHERMLVGDATTKTLLKEMWLIPSNRKRALISVALMIWQQMTGVNAVVSSNSFFLRRSSPSLTFLELLCAPNFQGPRSKRGPCVPPRDGRVRHCQGTGLPLLPPLRGRLSWQEAESSLDQRGAGYRHVHRRYLRARAASY